MSKEWTINQLAKECSKTKATIIYHIKRKYPDLIVANTKTKLTDAQAMIIKSIYEEPEIVRERAIPNKQAYTLSNGKPIMIWDNMSIDELLEQVLTKQVIYSLK